MEKTLTLSYPESKRCIYIPINVGIYIPSIQVQCQNTNFYLFIYLFKDVVYLKMRVMESSKSE